MFLALVTVMALVWANSPLSESYFELWHQEVGFDVGPAGMHMNLHHWINDGLMVIFFFLIGLEVRQEFAVGSLRDLRFDGLKVDRSFIQGIVDSPRDRVLLEAILAFARTLGVTVLAEGVETNAQFQLLRQLGCPAVQGYHFARAMPSTQTLAWITENDLTARIARQGWAASGWTIAAHPAVAQA